MTENEMTVSVPLEVVKASEIEPLEARHGVRRHGAVGVADVELGGRVIDGGGNVIITSAFFAHILSS